MLKNKDELINSNDAKLESFAKKNEKKKKFKKLILIPIGLAAIIIFFIVCFVFFFKVKTVEIVGASKYSPDLLIIKSGITAGENLYAYSESGVEETLMLRYPYISNVKLKRRWPDKIILEIEEEKAVYATEIYGETLILSKSLRILENPDTSIDSIELLKLVLPDIDRALVGNKPVFSKNADYIEKTLASIMSSSIADNLSYIDLRNKFSVSFLIGNTYKIKCGDTSDLPLKLTMTEKILASGQIPANTKAEIDVSNPSECSAVLGDSADISL